MLHLLLGSSLPTESSLSWITIITISANIGTILAGIAATFALLADFYARLFGKQPVLFLSNDISKQMGQLQLDLLNFGEASAKIYSIKTIPQWNELGNNDDLNPLDFIFDYTLAPADSLTLSLNVDKVTSLLSNYYKNEENLKKSYHIKIEIIYTSLSRTISKKPKKVIFTNNLTYIYMSSFPLSNIIPDKKAEQDFIETLKNLSRLD